MSTALASNSPVLHPCIISIVLGWYPPEGLAWCINQVPASESWALLWCIIMRRFALKHHAILKGLKAYINDLISNGNSANQTVKLPSSLIQKPEPKPRDLFCQLPLAAILFRHKRPMKESERLYVRWGYSKCHNHFLLHGITTEQTSARYTDNLNTPGLSL